MKREFITQEERVNARTQQVRAQRIRRARRNKGIAIALTSVCAVALLVGITAFGVSMISRNSSPVARKAAPAAITAVTQNEQKNQNAHNAQFTQLTQNEQTPEEVNYVKPYSPESDNNSADNNVVKTDLNTAESNNAQNTAAAVVNHSGAVSNGKGTPLHFYEQGKTSKGYNWKYEGGEYLVDVGCDYNLNTHTYDFSLIGLRPGSSTITVYHYTDDNTMVPTVINFTVDENLNVTYR